MSTSTGFAYTHPLHARRSQEATQDRKPTIAPSQSVTFSEESWDQYFNEVAMTGELANPVFVAPKRIPKPSKLAPGTQESRQGYIHHFTDKNPAITAFVRACRYRAVYGVYPDGSKDGPDAPSGLKPHILRELAKHVNQQKYLFWWQAAYPDDFMAWLIQNPHREKEFGFQTPPEFTATKMTTLSSLVAIREGRAA